VDDDFSMYPLVSPLVYDLFSSGDGAVARRPGDVENSRPGWGSRVFGFCSLS